MLGVGEGVGVGVGCRSVHVAGVIVIQVSL